MAGNDERQWQVLDDVPDDKHRDHGRGQGEFRFDEAVSAVGRGRIAFGSVGGRLAARSATVSELAEAVQIEQPAVSHQLRLLRNLSLVEGVRNGKSIVYSLYENHVAQLLDEAIYHVEHLRLGVPDRPAATG